MKQTALNDEQIASDLDQKYLSGDKEYLEKVQILKDVGYRIFRNNKGHHKVLRNANYLNEVFGGIFNGKS